jgi:hypothetical protein
MSISYQFLYSFSVFLNLDGVAMTGIKNRGLEGNERSQASFHQLFVFGVKA